MKTPLLRLVYLVGGFVVLVLVLRRLPAGFDRGSMAQQWLFFGLIFLYLWPLWRVPLRKWWAVAIGVAVIPFIRPGVEYLVEGRTLGSLRASELAAAVLAIVAVILAPHWKRRHS